MLNLKSPPPLSLYIHYPWCVQKCPYCDFNSHQQNDDCYNDTYVKALIKDLENELPSIWGRSIHSIFIGGGTPSLMQPKELDFLLCELRSRLNISPLTEITLEANPGTIDYVKFSEFKQLGINRLSIGIQSFADKQLKLLGRIHNSNDAINAVTNAKKAGFEQINLDLMFALPQQDLSLAKKDVKQAIDLEPEHISYYQLTIEPNTLFAQQTPMLPDTELAYKIQDQGHKLLAESGYNQYEISAWSKPLSECKHNINYWNFGDYIGIGAGAHGKITLVQDQTIFRNWKLKQPKQYMESAEKKYLGGKNIIPEDELIFEFMLNSTRLINGFEVELFNQNTGLSFKVLQDKMKKAMSNNLITIKNNIVRPTEQGFTFLNDLQESFL